MQIIQQQVIDDFSAVLKSQGLSESQIQEILLDVAAQAEVELADSLSRELPEDKQVALKEMLDQEKSEEEVLQFLGKTKEEIETLSIQKFAEVLSAVLATVTTEA